MKVHIYQVPAGHGHKKVADVIAQKLKQIAPSASVETLDALSFSPPWYNRFYTGIYYHSVKRTPDLWGWFYETLDNPFVYKCITPVRTYWNRFIGNKLIDFVLREKPDVAVCTHFYPAEVLGILKQKGLIKTKILTVVTDFHVQTFWINPETDFYWVMSEEGQKHLMSFGVKSEHIIPGGIPVEETFSRSGNRSEILKKWNFSENKLTLLLTSGSFGLGNQKDLLKELSEFSNQIQAFVVCGQNKSLKAELEQEKFDFPVQVFGFIDFMPDLMEASDLIIAKPGGSTTSESLAKNLPMVVMQPIPGQETQNANLLAKRNTSFFMREAPEIKTIVRTILTHSGILAEKKREIMRLAKPNAVFDISEFILKL